MVDQALKGTDVVDTLRQISEIRGSPDRIQVDNGSEFISKVLDLWAYQCHVTLDVSRPGTPTDNPFIESFHGSFRDECLNTHWFLSLDDALTCSRKTDPPKNGVSDIMGLIPRRSA